MTVTVDPATDLDRTRFFINDDGVEPRGTETHTALEAATGLQLGVASLDTDVDIDAAVKAAREALDNGPWGREYTSTYASGAQLNLTTQPPGNRGRTALVCTGMTQTSPVPPALQALAAYAAALERAAAEHPVHACRLLLEAADVWFCLGRYGRATELCAVALLANRPRRSRRRVEAPCLRAHARA